MLAASMFCSPPAVRVLCFVAGKMIPSANSDGKYSWWIVASGQCESDVCHVRDEEVQREMALAVRAISLKGLALTAALTVLFVGVPSHPLL